MRLVRASATTRSIRRSSARYPARRRARTCRAAPERLLPFASIPNNSASRSVSTTAAQFTATNGPFRRRPISWIWRHELLACSAFASKRSVVGNSSSTGPPTAWARWNRAWGTGHAPPSQALPVDVCFPVQEGLCVSCARCVCWLQRSCRCHPCGRGTTDGPSGGDRRHRTLSRHRQHLLRGGEYGSYLITTPEGHLLHDTGSAAMHDLIVSNIKKLGFDVRDIKIMLSSHAHWDHVEGHAAMKRLTGAQGWRSAVTPWRFESGRDNSAIGARSFESVRWIA